MKRVDLIDGNYIIYEEKENGEKPKVFYYHIFDVRDGEWYKVKCKITNWIPKRFIGTTIYPVVYLTPNFWDRLKIYPKFAADLLQHEFFHWKEQKDVGLIKWLAKYFWDWIRVGFKYSKLPDEHQADDYDENYEKK